MPVPPDPPWTHPSHQLPAVPPRHPIPGLTWSGSLDGHLDLHQPTLGGRPDSTEEPAETPSMSWLGGLTLTHDI
jgi:hypothetical protein